MSEVEQVRDLLGDAGIEHFELNGVFLCKGANGNIARISNYEDDDSQFQVKLDGLTPKQAVAALIASFGWFCKTKSHSTACGAADEPSRR